MDNVFDKAVEDYFGDRSKGDLLIHNKYGEPDEMPLDVYFRTADDLTDLEIFALEQCRGKVLDVGAGVGALSSILEERKFEVVSMEISSSLAQIMQERGIGRIINEDFLYAGSSDSFDTILMMMNGFGLCGSIDKLPVLFTAIDKYLNSDGQVIFDSSDLSYLYNGVLPKDKYHGEMDYRYEYNGQLGPWFKWLYIDETTLANEAMKHGFILQVLMTEGTGQYLGRLIRAK